ncbi:MAG: lipase, partial [Luteolibacter sp.]
QMRPGSSFLQELAATESQLGKIPVISYRTPIDLLILPSRSSEWQRATNISLRVFLHPMMVRAKSVMNDISMRLSEN